MRTAGLALDGKAGNYISIFGIISMTEAKRGSADAEL